MSERFFILFPDSRLGLDGKRYFMSNQLMDVFYYLGGERSREGSVDEGRVSVFATGDADHAWSFESLCRDVALYGRLHFDIRERDDFASC
jgi:hypothetical protein